MTHWMQCLPNLEIMHKNLCLTPKSCMGTSLIFQILATMSSTLGSCFPALPLFSFLSRSTSPSLPIYVRQLSSPLSARNSQHLHWKSQSMWRIEMVFREQQRWKIKSIISCVNLGKLGQIFNRWQREQATYSSPSLPNIDCLFDSHSA